MVHNNRNEDEVETDLFQEAGAVIHGGKMPSKKGGGKPTALQKIMGTREPCKCTKIASLN